MRDRIIIGFLIITAALIGAASATVFHPTPKSQLKKRRAVNRHPKNRLPLFLPTFDDEQEEYLNAHNYLRHKVGVPPLEWDPMLTEVAHAWAELRRGDCNYRYHSSNSFGENIYWMEYHEFTPTDVVQWWFEEYKLYDNSTHRCKCHPEKEGCECGHYLNIVWSTTRRVGCSGAVYCEDQKGVIVVCEYDPAGLIPGINPFTGDDLPGCHSSDAVLPNVVLPGFRSSNGLLPGFN